MEALLADRPIAIIEGLGLIAVSLGLVLASFARVRSQRTGRQLEQVFWRDVSQAGYLWAAASLLLLFGALAEVEGVRVPIWLVASMLVGLVGLSIARIRWLRIAPLASRPGIDDASRPEPARLVSTSWEVGLLGAGAGGLLVYGATLSHDWGHPVHWLVAGIGLVIGYAIGLLVATPRYAVRRGRA
jgi:hypothetical protein